MILHLMFIHLRHVYEASRCEETIVKEHHC